MSKRRRREPAPLANFLDEALHPALARQGFAQSDVILHWDEIVGARLAERTRPMRIVWPRMGPKRDPLAPREPATLVVQTDGAYAIEAQHLAPVILERVNAHLGWRCVARLQLRQAPIPAKPAARPVSPRPPVDVIARAQRACADVADESLRSALTRLGAAVFEKNGGRPG